jgi:putative membrane protein
VTDPAPDPRTRPALIELDDGPAADPGLETPVPDLMPEGRAMQTAGRLATRRTSALGRFGLWVFGALASLVISVAVWDFVTSLLTRNTLLGWLAFVLFGLALLVLVLLALREAAAFARIARIDRLRARAVIARTDLKQARAVVAAVKTLYRARPETAWGLSRLVDQEADIFDADALLALTERELLAPLDKAALAEVETAARQVATVTALVPMALADVATALYANLRMIRRLSQIYGGRSSTLGNLALLRRVFTALLGAGALALADDLIGSVASGGILSRLSRRFGEGVVNGALTTRVGLAAMEACRPLPFVALEKPGTTATTSRALAGLLGKAKPDLP